MGKKGKREKVLSKKQRAAIEEMEKQQAREQMLSGDGKELPACLQAAVITGNLASQEHARDLKIVEFSASVWGQVLVQDTNLELNYGCRYGLIGQNGSGKSTILQAIAHRQVPIPDHVDIWILDKEAEPTDISALQTVMDTAMKEYQRLEEQMMKLMEADTENEEVQELMGAIGEKMDDLDIATCEPRASELLDGLGFTPAMKEKATKDMSGGWRMRVSLAQDLTRRQYDYIQTLDNCKVLGAAAEQMTNPLVAAFAAYRPATERLFGGVWLENYLAKWKSILLFTSHSQDFLDGVCTNIMQLTQAATLVNWGGNYTQYQQTRKETETNLLKKYEKEQADIKHLEEFIRSCGTFSNLRKQADSKQKIIDKMKAAGLTEKPMPDPV